MDEFISIDVLTDLLQGNDTKVERSLRQGDTGPLAFAPKLAAPLIKLPSPTF